MSAQIITVNSAVTTTGPVLLRDGGVLAHPITLGQYQAFPLQSLQVSYVSGTVSTLDVTLEVSMTGLAGDWAVLGTPITNVAGGVITAAIQFPFPYVRANVNTLTGGGTVKVMLGVGRFFQG